MDFSFLSKYYPLFLQGAWITIQVSFVALFFGHLRRLRLLLEPAMDRHSSEEELERIAGATGPEGSRKWPRHGELSSASSDEEVKGTVSVSSLP